MLKPTISNKRSIQVIEYLAYSSAICLELIVLPALISKHALLLWWPPTGTHMNGYCCCITLYMHYILFVGNKISINQYQDRRYVHHPIDEPNSHLLLIASQPVSQGSRNPQGMIYLDQERKYPTTEWDMDIATDVWESRLKSLPNLQLFLQLSLSVTSGSGQPVPKTTHTEDNSYQGQLVPNMTGIHDGSYPGQLEPRTSRTHEKPDMKNYSPIMTILKNMVPLLVIFVMMAITINTLTLLNSSIVH